MKIQEQIQIVEDNLKEYGQCNITIEEFNYLKDELYSSGCLAGIELGIADAINPIQKFIDDYDGAIIISENMGVINGQQLINELKEIVEQLKEKNK